MHNRHKQRLIGGLFFAPILVALFTGEEFWPFTSFPMYSKPYQKFEWPSVQVRLEDADSWQPMIDEKCYGRIGYVRFHFSALRFSLESQPGLTSVALSDLAKSLAQEVHRSCPDRKWQRLKIVLLRHDVRAQSIPSNEFLRELTGEVPIEKMAQ